MSDASVWPAVGDARLLHVLQRQVAGALKNLHDCTEDGLGHLAKALEHHPNSEVTPHIMRALTDLQKIDRATQRLRNVSDSMAEWAEVARNQTDERPTWLDAVSARFVMPEEDVVLKQVLKDE